MIMIATDGTLINSNGRPRNASTYARVFDVYIREQKALTLIDAIRRLSLVPAQRLESFVP
jgi:hypothetical protein